MEYCNRCKKNVIVFRQEYTTMPQNTDNQVRHYIETFCALCGNCIHSEKVDKVAK